ncbi:MAG TPA: protein kinase [Planctomycetota bacterium]|nr:protein kinase [Planctomycetota bacterium]
MADPYDSGTASTLPFSVQVPGYRLRREAGGDAPGIWFDAEQVSLGRKVTLKVLRPQYEAHEGARREFLAEMDRLSQLDHSNLPHVLDTIREGTLVLVVERLPARTADELLVPGKPAGEATSLKLVRGVARALAHLVERGLAFKNVTPKLITLREDGEPRLVTFRNVISLEELGGLRGRLAQDAHYVAPEQLGGDAPIGPPAHAYHVAALLFHLLAGRPPHDGTPQEVARLHFREPFPSLKRLQPFLPSGIYDLIGACTARAPADRPPLKRVVEALDALVDKKDPGLGASAEPKGPIEAPRPRRKRRR